MPTQASGNKYFSMFQIKVDGYIHIRGLVGSDQDINLFAANSVQAATINLVPQHCDRFLLMSYAGDGNDQGAGIIQVFKNHSWIYYGMGNDPTRWAITFIPCKNSPGTRAEDFYTIIDGKPTLGYPAYGQLKYCVQAKNGNRILLNKPWSFVTDRANHPNDLRINDPFSVYYNGNTPKSNGLMSGLSITRPIFYNGYTNKVYQADVTQSYRLMQHTTTTITGADKKKYCINRYFFNKEVNTLNVAHATPNWNEVRIGNNELGVSYHKIDNIVIQQVEDPSNANNQKFRVIHNFNYLDRLLVSSSKSYTYRTVNGTTYIGGSKVSMCRKCKIEIIKNIFSNADSNIADTTNSNLYFFIKAGVIWKILKIIYDPSTTKYTIKYQYYTIPNAGGISKTNNPKTTDGTYQAAYNTGSVFTAYQYDAINNPHPTQGSFPSVWAYQAITLGEVVYYIWGFKHQFTAISPIVNYSNYKFLYSNTNKVIPPSLFTDIVSRCFHTQWSLYHSYTNNDAYNYYGNGAFDYYTDVNDSFNFGFRYLKPNLPYVYSWSAVVGGQFGNHATSVLIPPQNGNDGGDIEQPENAE